LLRLYDILTVKTVKRIRPIRGSALVHIIVWHHLEVLYQYLVDNISGPLEMAPLWPLTFSSGERPRVLSALLLKLSVSNLTLWYGIYFFASTCFWSNLICLMAGITIQRHFLWLQPLVNGNVWRSSNLQVKFY